MEYPFMDFENRIFHVNESVVFNITQINPMALMLIRNTQTGKPEAPMSEVSYGDKGVKVMEKNPFDKNYLDALDAWERDKALSLTKYLLCFGIKEDVPEDVYQAHKEILPSLGRGEIKYLWLCSLIKVDDLDTLTQAILGQNNVTEKGLEQVAESFPGEGKQQAN